MSANERIDRIGAGVEITLKLGEQFVVERRVFVHDAGDDLRGVGIAFVERLVEQALGVESFQVAFGRNVLHDRLERLRRDVLAC